MLLPRPSGLVTLLTDFGHRDPYVGIMKGMVKRQHASAEVLDVCHQVPPQNIDVASLFVSAMVDRFPDGTVHVVVVDPGVGTDRSILAVAALGCYWLAPDNGVLTPVLTSALTSAGEVRRLDLDRLGIEPESATFHGRDVFAPVAGMLSGGNYGFRALGARAEPASVCRSVVEPSAAGAAKVIWIDEFGNAILDRAGADLDAVQAVVVNGQRVERQRTYGEVPLGQPLALINSYGLLEIAINGGHAARHFGIELGTRMELQ